MRVLLVAIEHIKSTYVIGSSPPPLIHDNPSRRRREDIHFSHQRRLGHIILTIFREVPCIITHPDDISGLEPSLIDCHKGL